MPSISVRRLYQDNVKKLDLVWVAGSSGTDNRIHADQHFTQPPPRFTEAALVKALDDEGVKKRLLELGSVIPKPAERTPESLKKLVDSEITKWSGVLKPLN